MLGLKIQFGSYHALPIFGEVFMGIFFPLDCCLSGIQNDVEGF